jgi:predicted small lipoprotein YifL
MSILLFLYFSISACGNKGDLYMPSKDKDNTKKEQSAA